MKTLAVIKTGGKQYIVSPKQELKIEKLVQDPGSEFSFDEVLLISDGKETKIGTPFIANASVKAKVLGQGKHKKVVIMKYKPKIRYHKKTGHRQPFTLVRIEKIEN